MNAWISSVSIAALSLAGCSAGVGSRRVESLAAARGSSISTSLAAASLAPKAPAAPINATCPVLVGTPVDPAIRTLWQGRVVAFADAASLARWESSPLTFVGNLPRGSGSAGDAFLLSTARVVAAAPANPAVPARAIPAPAVAELHAPPVAAPTAPKPVAAISPAALAPAAASPATAPAAITPALGHPVAASGTGADAPAPAAETPVPALDDGTGSEECQDCPGGHCRLPGR